MRKFLIAASTAAATILSILPVEGRAHVTANPNAAPAGSFFRTALRVPHGCAGSATVAIRVRIPDGVTLVKPQMKPGWEITVTMRKLDPPLDDGHGGKITETVDEVAWRGGPLPDAYFDEFGLRMRLPARPGTTVYFPVVQECETGVHRWIEIPKDGRTWNDLDEPAPFVELHEPRHGRH